MRELPAAGFSVYDYHEYVNFTGGRPMKTYMANPDKIERKWYVVSFMPPT